MPARAAEPGTFKDRGEITPISFEWMAQESPPFAEFTSKQSNQKSEFEAPVSKTSDAVPTPVGPSEGQVLAARGAMRESLIREGESSAADRDALTAEFFSVMRWTIVTLVVGGLAAFGLKRFPQWNRPPVVGTKMSVVESLSVGRHQVLNLVQAGGERFLVASDPGGIRSVTLLPNWPSQEEEEPVLESPSLPSPSSIQLFNSPNGFPSVVHKKSEAA
ncbi:MAG TPA: flagellar biosynthetic protein FliO [Planctomicrobium sp.]|nr:flagellar biosynthetic protein FliO [Planctomicrobium sp.]